MRDFGFVPPAGSKAWSGMGAHEQCMTDTQESINEAGLPGVARTGFGT